MAGRFAGIKRCLPLFLVLVAIPLSGFAQSRHYPNDKTHPGGAATADCAATTSLAVDCGGVAANCNNMPDEPLPSGGGKANFFFLSVSYNGRRFDLGSTTCYTAPLAWPFDPKTADSAGVTPSGTGCNAGAGINSGVLSASILDIACQRGVAVSRRIAKTFCYNALGRGRPGSAGTSPPPTYTVKVDNSDLPASEADCASIADANGNPIPATPFTALTIQPDDSPGPKCGFKIAPKVTAGADGLGFTPFPPGPCPGPTVFGSLSMVQTITPDMNRFLYIQVDPQGQTTGNLTFKLWQHGNQTSTSDCSFTVNLTTNTATLHNDIVTGFNQTCSSLGAHANRNSPQNTRSPFIDLYPGPDIVWVTNAANTLEAVQISSTNPQAILRADSSDVPERVPVLSPWGIGLMVAALLLSSLWLVRRQRRLHRA
jgi:hypothetical protein